MTWHWVTRCLTLSRQKLTELSLQTNLQTLKCIVSVRRGYYGYVQKDFKRQFAERSSLQPNRRNVKYQIIDNKEHLVIKVSGDTRKNEALPAKKLLARHLRKNGMRVIVDMAELNQVEPITLVGILNAIRREVRLLNGDLKLRSVRPEILGYFQAHRLDRVFKFCHEKDSVGEGE